MVGLFIGYVGDRVAFYIDRKVGVACATVLGELPVSCALVNLQAYAILIRGGSGNTERGQACAAVFGYRPVAVDYLYGSSRVPVSVNKRDVLIVDLKLQHTVIKADSHLGRGAVDSEAVKELGCRAVYEICVKRESFFIYGNIDNTLAVDRALICRVFRAYRRCDAVACSAGAAHVERSLGVGHGVVHHDVIRYGSVVGDKLTARIEVVVSAEDEVYSELVHSSHHILRSAYYSGILRLGAARVEGPVDNHDVPQRLGAVLDSVLNEGEVLAHRAHVHIQVHEQSVVVGVVVVRRCGADAVGRAEIREVVVVCVEGCVVMSRTI